MLIVTLLFTFLSLHIRALRALHKASHKARAKDICEIIHQKVCLWCLTPFICSALLWWWYEFIILLQNEKKQNYKLSTYKSEVYVMIFMTKAHREKSRANEFVVRWVIKREKRGEIYSDWALYNMFRFSRLRVFCVLDAINGSVNWFFYKKIQQLTMETSAS